MPMMQVLVNRVLCTALAVAVVACDHDGVSTRRIVRDSAGVELIDQPLGSTERMTLSTAAVVDFATTAGSEFYRVMDARILQDGAVVVANAGTAQIRIFDPDGHLEVEFGRRGKGPGEFRFPARVLEIAGGRLLVADPLQLRLAIFTRSGELVQDVPIPNRGVQTWVVGWLESESVVIEYSTVRPSPDKFRTEAMQYDVFRWATATSDSILRATSGTMGFVGGMEPWGVVDHPLFEAIVKAASVNGLLVLADGRTPSLQFYSRNGHLVRVLRWPAEVEAVTETDVLAYQRQRLAEMDGPEARSRMAKQLDAYPVAEQFPFVGALRVDHDQRIWVQQYRRPTDTVQAWYVFDLASETVSTVELGASLELMDARGHDVLVVERDALDVEHVRIYTLQSHRLGGSQPTKPMKKEPH